MTFSNFLREEVNSIPDFYKKDYHVGIKEALEIVSDMDYDDHKRFIEKGTKGNKSTLKNIRKESSMLNPAGVSGKKLTNGLLQLLENYYKAEEKALYDALRKKKQR